MKSPYFSKVTEIGIAPILEHSKLPKVDFVINPYIGCRVGCQYCYASKSGSNVDEPIEAWGNFVYAKVNAINNLSLEMTHFSGDELKDKKILLSDKTDPYQGCEVNYQLTRKILQYLANQEFPGTVGILTKSPLVLRDIKIIQKIQTSEVGLTITTLDEELARNFEKHAPSVSKRLKALKILHEEGIYTFAFVGPLYPHYLEKPYLLEELFYKLKSVGVHSVFVEHLNSSPCVELRFRRSFSTYLYNYNYEEVTSEEFRHELENIVISLINKTGISLNFGKVLYQGKTA